MTPIEIQINTDFNREELVAKFNLVSKKTDSNTIKLNNLYSKESEFNLNLERRFNRLEKNICKKIDGSNKEMDKRMDKIEQDYLINEVKDEASFTNFLNIGFKNVLLKLIEYSLLAIIAYAIMHMKK